MERIGDRSYHYLVDNDPDGNAVYDLVDTDRASWSVLDANARSINLVIGASFAAWSRQEWINSACDGLHRNPRWNVTTAAVGSLPGPRGLRPGVGWDFWPYTQSLSIRDSCDWQLHLLWEGGHHGAIDSS
jgi:N-acetylmuramoyl-L-alanine amidase